LRGAFFHTVSWSEFVPLQLTNRLK
jgi:hypothetical protein